jgi:hypothetical protein
LLAVLSLAWRVMSRLTGWFPTDCCCARGPPPHPTSPAEPPQTNVAQGIECQLLTGDTWRAARAVGKQLAVPAASILAEVLPAGKADVVAEAQVGACGTVWGALFGDGRLAFRAGHAVGYRIAQTKRARLCRLRRRTANRSLDARRETRRLWGASWRWWGTA